MKDLYKELIKPMVSYQEHPHDSLNHTYMHTEGMLNQSSATGLKLSESKQYLISVLAEKLDVKRKQL